MARKQRPSIVIFLTYISVQISLVTTIVCGPTFQRIFDLSNTELGISLGAPSVGVLVMSLAVGHITHRWGPSPILVGGLIGIMCGMTSVVVATGFWMLIISIAAIGIATAFVGNANATFLADLFPGKLRRIMALASGLWFGSSVVFAPAIGFWLEAAKKHDWQQWSFRLPYLLSILATGVCLLLVCQSVRPIAKTLRVQGKHNYSSDKSIRKTARSNEWLWIPFLSFCHGLIVLSLLAWINPMIQAKFSGDEFQGAFAFAMMALGFSIGRLLLAAVRFTIDDRIILSFSSIGGGILFAMGLTNPTYTATIIIMAVGGLLVSPTAACIFSLVAVRFPAKKSLLYGYMEASIALAGLAGSCTVGVLADIGLPLSKALWISPVAALSMGLASMLWVLRDGQGTRLR